MIPRPPPPVDGRRHPAFFDTECYPNFWLLKMRPRGGAVFTFALCEGQRFTIEQAQAIGQMFDSFCAVSFNGRGYDQWMIAAAISGATPAELKSINDQIIVQRIKPWDLALPRWEPADHIDVMEVAPGAGSLKQYAGRIHAARLQDLPYPPDEVLTPARMAEVSTYCENDLAMLEALFDACEPLLQQREALGKRYGMDLRSKSDAQVAEAVLRKRCELATGQRIYKPDVNWGQTFRYKVPPFITYSTPQLQRALQLVRDAVFMLGTSGAVVAPPQIEGLEIVLGGSTYSLGIGGLHSQEKRTVHRSSDAVVIRDNDVASYYPSLILNSGEWPPALGEAFRGEYYGLLHERLQAKDEQARLEAAGHTGTPAHVIAKTMNEGGKIMINGTFGKTGSPFSVLFAPSMLIQTTITGQLSLLMLIEWHELYGIPVISANTDGVVIACPRHLVPTSEALIAEWQTRTGLKMETVEYRAVYSRDVNNYFAVKMDGKVKRKGEYSKAGLVEKKNPDCEICSDAVADFLARGVPVEATIFDCADVRKFVTMQKVDGGGIKLWGDGPRKTDKVRDMVPRIEAHGWVKQGRQWAKNGTVVSAHDAYASTFAPQVPEYLGKVVRWYYSTQAPGPIVYAARNAVVGLSYGARPCMTLPERLPADIDYQWYIDKAHAILRDVGYYTLTQ